MHFSTQDSNQISALAARVFQVRGVFIALTSQGRPRIVSPCGGQPDEFLPLLSACAQQVRSPDGWVAEDAQADARFATLPAFADHAPVCFFAGAPLRAAGGELLGALCLLHDAPRALSQSERDTLRDLAQMLMRTLPIEQPSADTHWPRALARNAPDMALVLDAQGCLLYQNPASARALGDWTHAASDADLLGRVHPQDRQRVRDFWECTRNVPGQHPPLEFRVRPRSGGVRSVQAVCFSSLGDPAAPGVLAHLRDVSAERQAQDARREAEGRLDILGQVSPLAIFSFDLAGRITNWSHAAQVTFGWSRAEAVGCFLPMLPPSRHAEFADIRAGLLRGETFREREMRCQAKSGICRDADVSCGPLRDAQGQVCGGMAVMSDISRRKQDAAAIAHAEAKFRGIFEHAVEGIFQTTPQGSFVSANPSLARILGYGNPALLMEHVLDIGAHLYASETRRAEFIALMEAEAAVTDFVSQVYRTNGTLVWISENARAVRGSDGLVAYYEGTVEDITERMTLEAEREGQLAEALERADHDPLTGLLNHRAFHRALEQEADRTLREGTTLAIAVLDLDNFKFFNDAYGHAVGDDVLRQVSSTLSVHCRSYDTLARFGGDEFAMLLPGMTEEQAGEFAARLRAQAQNIGFQPPGGEALVPLGLSVGVAIFPDEGPGRLEALARADTRLLRAKSGGQDEATERLRAGLNQSMEGFSILDALVTAVDNKDRYTRRHSEDVMRYSVAIARTLGLDEQTQRLVEVAGLLHDVGKIGVPDAILRKPGALNDDEFHAVRHHPMMGSIIVSSVPGFEDMLDAVRHHHERWDGEGYPFGLCGLEIPLLARIMAVGDAYSAMTTNRPYRKGMNPVRALAILERGAGTQWDPECVFAFAEAQRLSHEAREAADAARRPHRRTSDALGLSADASL